MVYSKWKFLREGSYVNQVLCAVLINLTVFSYGASMGWMSPMSLLLQSTNSPKGVPLTDTEISWIAAICYLTGPIGNYFLVKIGDNMGRKPAIMLISFSGAVAWSLMLCSMDLWAMILARVLVGITMPCYVIGPAYTKEISDDRTRGAMGCFTMLFHTSGNLFLYIIGDLLEYNTVLWICLAIPVFHMIVFTMIPESPSYLVKKGNIKKATEVLGWLRCKKTTDPSIQEELNRVISEEEIDKLSKHSVLKNIWCDKILWKAFTISMVTTIARDLCGAIAVINFAGEIFSVSSEGTGFVLTANQQAMVLGVVQVVAVTSVSTIIDKAGRKVILLSSALISGVSMLVLASWFLAKEFELHLPAWIPVIALCLCIFCDAAGLMPVSFVLTNEIFSFKYRSTALATVLTFADIIDFLQLLFFKPLASSCIFGVFYFFAMVCLASAAYVIIVIPETKGRTLEDIYKDLGETRQDRNKSSEM